ncbi:hypothetical protein Y032_0029g1884 [Ancylostoma ceylanicum]|uniref:Uncharacterized protein n=1 Tax=Ancylostoma ceylanicum TaxID=53326 RepID=A0A016URH3_9BILA|nr:hypothetical protein Y032_0029g1884 [Ancylostoma ceylanicum]
MQRWNVSNNDFARRARLYKIGDPRIVVLRTIRCAEYRMKQLYRFQRLEELRPLNYAERNIRRDLDQGISPVFDEHLNAEFGNVPYNRPGSLKPGCDLQVPYFEKRTTSTAATHATPPMTRLSTTFPTTFRTILFITSTTTTTTTITSTTTKTTLRTTTSMTETSTSRQVTTPRPGETSSTMMTRPAISITNTVPTTRSTTIAQMTRAQFDRPWIRPAPSEDYSHQIIPPIPVWMTSTKKTTSKRPTSIIALEQYRSMTTPPTIRTSIPSSAIPFESTPRIEETVLPPTRRYVQPYHPMVWPPPRNTDGSKTSTETPSTTRSKRILQTTTADLLNFPSPSPRTSQPTENIYPHNNAVRRHFNNICVRHFLSVQRLHALSAADPTWAARVLIGRTDIAAAHSARKLLITRCRQVTPTHKYTNHTINGTCYALTPVIIVTDLLFIVPGTRDLTQTSATIPCSHLSVT